MKETPRRISVIISGNNSFHF